MESYQLRHQNRRNADTSGVDEGLENQDLRAAASRVRFVVGQQTGSDSVRVELWGAEASLESPPEKPGALITGGSCPNDPAASPRHRFSEKGEFVPKQRRIHRESR